MAKHRKEGPVNDVMVGSLYLGTQDPANKVGQIILTENQAAVMVFDEETVGRSVAKLLSPDGALPLSFTDEDVLFADRSVVVRNGYGIVSVIPTPNPTLF